MKKPTAQLRTGKPRTERAHRASSKQSRAAVPVATSATFPLPVQKAPIHPGSLLSITQLDLEDVGRILHQASDLESAAVRTREERLHKRRVSLLFYESSTRTRTSFELAAKSLGADTVLVSALSSSIEKGESLKDTGITLRALGAECIILRHAYSGAPYLLAQATGLPILNAGDGIHEHPSQALLDLRTILFRCLGAKSANTVNAKTLSGMTVAIVGDIFHSRVARSNALLLPKLGARVLFCGPEPLLPEHAAEIGPGVSIERDLNRALEQADVVMMLRIQKERLAGLHLDLEEYTSRYQLDGKRLAQHAPRALVLHPGPIIRGMEITSEVADGAQSAIEEQVRHGLAIRMALLMRALETPATAKQPRQPGEKTKR
jgi:aspartate carbamoyltransferase catalytic subunit